MKTIVDERLLRQAKQFAFRYSCEHCAHFDEETRSCAEGYPNEEHLGDRLREAEILFCKLFEGA